MARSSTKVTDLPVLNLLQGDELFYCAKSESGVQRDHSIRGATLLGGARLVRLSGDTVFYVSTGGSDVTGTGTLANPWATPSHAYDVLTSDYDFGGHTVEIRIADGNYNSVPHGDDFTSVIGLTKTWTGGGSLLINGNYASPANVTFDARGTACIACGNSSGPAGVVTIQGVKLVDTVGGGNGIIWNCPGTLVFFGLDFGSFVGGTHVLMGAAGKIVAFDDHYTISGGANYHIFAEAGAFFDMENMQVTLTGTPNFASAFVTAYTGAQIYYIFGCTFVGSAATGKKFEIGGDGGILTDNNGLSFLPGSIAGTGSRGALYDKFVFFDDAVYPLISAAHDFDAAAAGVPLGGLYRTDNVLRERIGTSTNPVGGGGAGTGDVVGPGSATDNAVARFDGTTGKLIQNSLATLSDSGDLTTQSNSAGLLGPTIAMYHNSASPAADDVVGAVAFYGNSNTLVQRPYGALRVFPFNVTNGSEGSYATLDLLWNGASYSALTIDGNFDFNSPSAAQSIRVNRTDLHGPNQDVGYLEFRGLDSASNVQTYAYFTGRCDDDTAGSEDGSINVNVMIAGVDTTYASFGRQTANLDLSGTTTPQVRYRPTSGATQSTWTFQQGDFYRIRSDAQVVMDMNLLTGQLKLNVGYGLGFIRSDTSGNLISSLSEDVATLVDGATVAVDASLGNIFHLTAAGNRTLLAPTNAPGANRTQRMIIRHQASGADRTLTLTTGSAGAFRFGTTVTGLTPTLNGTVDWIGCLYNQPANRWDVVAYAKGF